MTPEEHIAHELAYTRQAKMYLGQLTELSVRNMKLFDQREKLRNIARALMMALNSLCEKTCPDRGDIDCEHRILINRLSEEMALTGDENANTATA